MKQLLVATILFTLSGISLAGYINHYQVSVNTTTRTAYGSMVGARNSADSVQYIGCQLVNSGTPYAICSARNSAGTKGYCTTSNAMHMQQVTGLSNETYLYYQWDTNGKCTYIYSSTMSTYHN